MSERGFSSSLLKRMLIQINRKILLSCTANGLPKNRDQALPIPVYRVVT